MSLELLDTWIGFALAMLLLSLLVMSIVSAITIVVQMRGRMLLGGVGIVLEQLGVRGLDKQKAKQVAKEILQHRSISKYGFYPAAIRANELVDLYGKVALKLQLTVPQDLEDNINKWFDTVMDRTTERFVASSRWITIAVSLVICAVLQVDALSIYDQVSTDKRLRDSLVASAADTLKKAAEVTANAELPLGTAAIEAMQQDEELKENIPELAKLNPVDLKLVTKQLGEDWIREQISDGEAEDKLVEAYKKEFSKLADKRLKILRNVSMDITSQMKESELELFDYSFNFTNYLNWRHAIGTVCAMLLLSLGAPFWFNALKTMSNLRPILARKVDQNND